MHTPIPGRRHLRERTDLDLLLENQERLQRHVEELAEEIGLVRDQLSEDVQLVDARIGVACDWLGSMECKLDRLAGTFAGLLRGTR
jgi:hypothetical protein